MLCLSCKEWKVGVHPQHRKRYHHVTMPCSARCDWDMGLQEAANPVESQDLRAENRQAFRWRFVDRWCVGLVECYSGWRSKSIHELPVAGQVEDIPTCSTNRSTEHNTFWCGLIFFAIDATHAVEWMWISLVALRRPGLLAVFVVATVSHLHLESAEWPFEKLSIVECEPVWLEKKAPIGKWVAGGPHHGRNLTLGDRRCRNICPISASNVLRNLFEIERFIGSKTTQWGTWCSNTFRMHSFFPPKELSISINAPMLKQLNSESLELHKFMAYQQKA